MKVKGEFEKGPWHTSFRKLCARHVCLLLLCLPVHTPAQSYKILHMFGTNVMGFAPRSTLVQGADGMLYGTAEQGGSGAQGQVFKVNPDGTGYTVLKDFTGPDGAWPDADLVLSGSTLYGTTRSGGTNYNGTIFKLNTDGSGFAILRDFGDGIDGSGPTGTLLLSGTTLFGTASGGGIDSYGTLFELSTDGTGYAVLKYFTGEDGANPYGGLLLSGTTLYGTTSAGGGGAGNVGTIFRIGVDGRGYTVLKHFMGGSDGSGPCATLVISDNTLYGTATWGGGYGNGTIFKLRTDGTGFGVLKNFSDSSEGAYCYAGLLLSGSTLYGTAVSGGTSSLGTVFKVNTDGTGFSVLKSFPGGPDGAYPYAGLLLSGSTLYGTTTAGGIRGMGTVFKLDTDGGGYGMLTQFIGGDGGIPSGAPVLSGTNCYGATSWGGAAANGTIFRIGSDGTGYTTLKDFTNSFEGSSPNGGMVLSGTTLYGTTMSGGSNSQGALFKMNIDGSDFSVLHNFSAAAWGGPTFTNAGPTFTNADGSIPNGDLVLSGTTLYGTASQGGSNACGTVFKVNTDGTDFTVLYTFSATGSDGSSVTNAEGAWPYQGLVLSGSTLYGTAGGGGTLGWGTVFRVNTDGGSFSVLKTFSGDDAGYPRGLVLTNDILYGTANYAGGSWQGAIFRLNTDGSGYSVLHSLTNDEGGTPSGLILAGSTLYGYAAWGGMIGGGTIFQINTDGGGYSVLKNFTYDDGNSPGGLVLADRTLFGVTGNGGYMEGNGGFGSGVLFSLSLLPGAPAIQLQPQSQVLALNSYVWLQVLASGIPAPAYQWYFNGVALEGATNSYLEFTNVQTAQAGVYSVVITNIYGSVTSVVATLTVQDPFINAQPNSQFAPAGETASFYCDAGGTPPLSFQWFKDGASLTDGGNISGAQTATLTVSNVVASDAGRYSVVISNTNSSLSSATAVLVVQDPFIAVQPWSQFVNVGNLAEFSVVAHGTDLTYQWVKDGVPLSDGGNISGAHTPTLTLNAVAGSDAGFYSAFVSNSYDALVSAPASLVVNPAQSYSILHSFTGSAFNGDGTSPQLAELALSGSTLYGTTANGGSTNAGAVFKVNTDGSGYAVLYSFSWPVGWLPTNSDGWGPLGGLAVSGTTLYGTAQQGGINDKGTVFKLNTDGSGFLVLKTFQGDDGAYPTYNLTLASETLYGITWNGGSNNWGTVFKLNTDGSGFEVLHNFAGVLGEGRPSSPLVISGGLLYGTTCGDPPNYGGAVFRMHTDGSGFVVLKQFSDNDGLYPAGALFLSDNILYGITQGAGNQTNGTVYKINTDGTGYGIVHSFRGGPNDGANPISAPVLVGTALYGTTEGGGSCGLGTMFRVNTNGTGYFVLREFAGSDGALPFAGVIAAGSTLYGTTYSGGASNSGLVFSLSLLPHVAISPSSQSAELGSSVEFRAQPANAPLVSYQWLFNGLSLGTAATNSVLSFSNVQGSNSGPYGLVTSNSFGAVTSAPAMLQVIAPVERRPVPAIGLIGDAGSLLNLDYASSIAPVPNWLLLDTVSMVSTSQLYFDITAPMVPERYYRAWQTGTPVLRPALNMPGIVPAITLTGNISDHLRLDYINQVGPIDAWVTLGTITLTNTSQLYFDVTSIGQPPRLYRIVPLP